MSCQNPLVHPVDDERNIAIKSHFPAAFEHRLRNPGQVRVPEDGDRVGLCARCQQITIGLRPGVDGLVYQQPRTVERGDDTKGNDPRPADGKGHRKTGQDASEEAEKDDDQADFDAIKSKKHSPVPLTQCVPS